jgi:predicted nucleotidyltransferase
MSKVKAKEIVKKYVEKLKAEKFPFSAVYLFGSFAKGKAHKWSDIDVAVVSKKLDENTREEKLKLWKFRDGVSDLIEPHGFTPKDFADYWNPMAHEVKKTGIRVA